VRFLFARERGNTVDLHHDDEAVNAGSVNLLDWIGQLESNVVRRLQGVP
jgi:hypothetical protein